MNTKKQQYGFTVVELVVVISVLALLALIVANLYSGANVRARDARRAADLQTIKGLLMSYSTTRGYLPRTLTYGEVNGGGYDTSAAGEWLPFLTAISNAQIPKDPVNNEPGDPTLGNAQTGKFTYFYYCYNPSQDSWSPNPPSNTARFGYRTELTGQLKVIDIDVDSCQ